MHNTNISCGCIIEYEGDQTHQDYSINWCPLHAAACNMLKALQAVKYLGQYNPITPEEFDVVEAAIAKATGGQ